MHTVGKKNWYMKASLLLVVVLPLLLLLAGCSVSLAIFVTLDPTTPPPTHLTMDIRRINYLTTPLPTSGMLLIVFYCTQYCRTVTISLTICTNSLVCTNFGVDVQPMCGP